MKLIALLLSAGLLVCCAPKQKSPEKVNERVFYVAEKRGDSYIVYSSSVRIFNDRFLYDDTGMEPYTYLLSEFSADSTRIEFRRDAYVYYQTIHAIDYSAMDKSNTEKYKDRQVDNFAKISEWLWRWKRGDKREDLILIDSMDVSASGYISNSKFLSLDDVKPLTDLPRTFYSIDYSRSEGYTIDTTCFVRIESGDKIVFKDWNEEYSYQIDVKESFIRTSGDVIHVIPEYTLGEKYCNVTHIKSDGRQQVHEYSKSKPFHIFLISTLNDQPLIWEDWNNLDVYFIDSTDVARSGFRYVQKKLTGS